MVHQSGKSLHQSELSMVLLVAFPLFSFLSDVSQLTLCMLCMVYDFFQTYPGFQAHTCKLCWFMDYRLLSTTKKILGYVRFLRVRPVTLCCWFLKATTLNIEKYSPTLSDCIPDLVGVQGFGEIYFRVSHTSYMYGALSLWFHWMFFLA